MYMKIETIIHADVQKSNIKYGYTIYDMDNFLKVVIIWCTF